MSNKKGFSLSELTILLLISSFVLLAAIPALTMMKRSFMVKDRNVVACVTSGHADNIDLSKTVFSQILPDTDCQAAVKSCKAGLGNSCETMVSYINAYPTRAKKLLRASCDNGAKGACRYFIDACSKDNATCDIPTADAANQDLDLNYYLNLDTTSDVAGRTVIENDTVEHMGFGFANVSSAVEESCKNQNGDTACKIAADDCTENGNGTSCGYVVAGCNAGKANACKQGYSSGISRTCQSLKDVGKQNADGIYAIVPDGSLAFKTYCDMTSDGGGWTLVALNNSAVSGSVNYTWEQATKGANYHGTVMNDLTSFKEWIGLDYWNNIGNKLKYQVGTSPTNIAHKAVYDVYIDPSNYYTLNLKNEDVQVCTVSDCSTGLFKYHNNKPFSTTGAGNDHDGASNSCADTYQSGWWYNTCWLGSLWGGSTSGSAGCAGNPGGVCQNGAYWGYDYTDYYAHGSIWIRDDAQDYLPSCSAIKKANPQAGSGKYKIDPDGTGSTTPFDVYCDMSTDGGGWTLVSRIIGADRLHVNTTYIGALNDPTQAASAKFSDTRINSIPHNIYRLTCDGKSDFLKYNTGWNSTGANNTANWTGYYHKDKYTDPAWMYNTNTSVNDNAGGSWPDFDALQYNADGLNGCLAGDGNPGKDGTLWVKQANDPEPATNCQRIKAANSNSKDGVYIIDPDGNGGQAAFPAYCDMTTDGGGWTLLFNHNIAGGYFANDAEALNINETAIFSTAIPDKYSILNKIPLFKYNAGYTFRINWPQPPPINVNVTNIWYQTSNPTDNIAVTGYTPLSIYTASEGWGGLEYSHLAGQDAGAVSFLDGSVTGSSCPNCWHYSIGAQTSWRSTVSDTAGIPSSLEVNGGSGVPQVQLWIRDSFPVSNPTSCLNIYNKYNSLRSGLYTIDPDGATGNAPFNVYCDMTNGDAGYTVLSSCNELNARGLKGIGAPNLTGNDGTYMINPSGTRFKAYCDMTTDGGGWTLAFNNLYSTFNAASDGVTNDVCFSSDCQNLAYSALPIGNDLMFESNWNGALTTATPDIRVIIKSIVQGKNSTLKSLFNAGGSYSLDRADNTNLTYSFRSGFTMPSGDYARIILGSSGTCPGCVLQFRDQYVFHYIGGDDGTVTWGNSCGWPDSVIGTPSFCENHWPQSFRTWVR